LDALFDFFAAEPLFQRQFDEGGDFRVRGEAESDELVFGELGDAAFELFREEHGEAQALFEADDAVLDLERVEALLEQNDDERNGNHDEPDGDEQVVGAWGEDAADEDRNSENEGGEEETAGDGVVGGVEAAVVLEALRFTHDEWHFPVL